MLSRNTPATVTLVSARNTIGGPFRSSEGLGRLGANARVWLHMLRVRQWPKNALVFIAFLFSTADRQQHVDAANLQKALLAVASFCLLSSAVYIMNDLRDRAKDRAHPRKRNRPLAAGLVSPAQAVTVAFALLALALAGASLLGPAFIGAQLAYLGMQIFYTFWLKHVALVDVFVVAFGFVIRAAAGALAIHVFLSPWLLLCSFLLALFIALCKRRQEKVNGGSHATRTTMEDYDVRVLDQLITVAAAASITAYSLYTQASETVARFGSHALGITIPFVVFGVFRYMDIVYRDGAGEYPEQVIVKDRTMQVVIVLFFLSLVGVLYWGRIAG